MSCYLPGSSLRGVIRSAAERILRTELKRWCDDNGVDYWHLQQTIVCDPHGTSIGTPPRLLKCKVSDADRKQGAGHIKGCLCLACRLFGSTDLGGRIAVSEAYPTDPGKYDDALKLLQHVAVDRFGGGAADQRLYNERPAYPWPTMTEGDLDMSFTLELYSPEEWELALISFVLRDLMKGRLRIGYGKLRGLGKARVVVDSLEGLLASKSPFEGLFPETTATKDCFPFLHYSRPMEDFLTADDPIRPFLNACVEKWRCKLQRYAIAKLPQEVS
jgi:CRISPR/Cas system CSM-associated protein Csm3 (group 7 of RAMP superfamily)